MVAVGFEPTPSRTSALNWRLGPLGQTTCYYSLIQGIYILKNITNFFPSFSPFSQTKYQFMCN